MVSQIFPMVSQNAVESGFTTTTKFANTLL